MVNKKNILKLSMAIGVSVTSLNAYSVPTNQFCLQGDNKNDKIFYRLRVGDYYPHSITAGKKYLETFDGGDNCLYIDAERQLDSKNHENINWIKANMAEGLAWQDAFFSTTDGASKGTPQALNFAVKANLVFLVKGNFDDEYDCYNVIIAQGSTSTRNNWWMVSNNNDKPHTLKCYDYLTDQPVYFYMAKGSDIHTLKLTRSQNNSISAAGTRFW